eukprot:9348478-Ditylum_brightwellii.AAC.1
MRVKLRPEYASFNKEDLDPFKRFTSRKVTQEEYYFDIFNIEGIILGTAYEGIVAFHAIYNEACLS